MAADIYIYIFVMAGVTYLIRMLPLALIRREIKSVYVKSFLYYVPYVVLTVMTFPAILGATANIASAAAGLVVAGITAWRGGGLFRVAAFACMAVFLVELIPL